MDYAFAPGATRQGLRARQLPQCPSNTTLVHKPNSRRVSRAQRASSRRGAMRLSELARDTAGTTAG